MSTPALLPSIGDDASEAGEYSSAGEEDVYMPIQRMATLADYEFMDKLGSGTFGVVHKARDKKTGQLVAMKQILYHSVKEGFPITALREITILKQLHHANVLSVQQMIFEEPKVKDKTELITQRGTFYTVAPYMTSDLVGLLKNPNIHLELSQIKCLMQQLLTGTQYIHDANFLHRDIKAANILVDQTGVLKIADFGLARLYHGTAPRLGMGPGGGEKSYTSLVITRWYRPPEILLGERKYTTAVDLWGVGCVFGELFTGNPILQGNTDAQQAQLIFELVGSPKSWSEAANLPNKNDYNIGLGCSRSMEARFEKIMPASGVSLLSGLLTLDPYKRLNALDALNHEFFTTEPLPLRPDQMPRFEECHEIDKERFKTIRNTARHTVSERHVNTGQAGGDRFERVNRQGDEKVVRHGHEDNGYDEFNRRSSYSQRYNPSGTYPEEQPYQDERQYQDERVYQDERHYYEEEDMGGYYNEGAANDYYTRGGGGGEESHNKKYDDNYDHGYYKTNDRRQRYDYRTRNSDMSYDQRRNPRANYNSYVPRSQQTGSSQRWRQAPSLRNSGGHLYDTEPRFRHHRDSPSRTVNLRTQPRYHDDGEETRRSAPYTSHPTQETRPSDAHLPNRPDVKNHPRSTSKEPNGRTSRKDTPAMSEMKGSHYSDHASSGPSSTSGKEQTTSKSIERMSSDKSEKKITAEGDNTQSHRRSSANTLQAAENRSGKDTDKSCFSQQQQQASRLEQTERHAAPSSLGSSSSALSRDISKPSNSRTPTITTARHTSVTNGFKDNGETKSNLDETPSVFRSGSQSAPRRSLPIKRETTADRESKPTPLTQGRQQVHVRTSTSTNEPRKERADESNFVSGKDKLRLDEQQRRGHAHISGSNFARQKRGFNYLEQQDSDLSDVDIAGTSDDALQRFIREEDMKNDSVSRRIKSETVFFKKGKR
ncbi:uncharacterized protein LODBEIA_P01630 [Lodderomyces beijingensis]|uniref:Serine/threonine-protein kinase BUR1 n=1 Tax=Lodderomyces beijingensis TaxID=1775926 RepID=A0ABP0ZCM3_9ASCO